MMKGLYIHVPFCRRKCLYCDFYSLAQSEEYIPRYVEAVKRNIRHTGERYDTVYFGGGTPSLLSPSQIYGILSSADIDGNAEISMECNPDSADRQKLLGYRESGINRLSFGVQSLDGKELEMLGRLHSEDQALDALRNAAECGFENISADLMLGLPFQKWETIERNINTLSETAVTHISAYMLKIEEGTPLSLDERLVSAAADDDRSADYYEKAVALLEEKGFYQYEISNFSKKGYECRHNLKYWECRDYTGIGPSAHSCSGGKRYAVPDSLTLFTDNDLQQTYITDDEPYTEEERIMLGIRLNKGIEVPDSIIKKALPLEKGELLKINGNRISLTPKGMLVSNSIICMLCS